MLTTGELAETLKISEDTVRRMARDGLIAGVDVGGRWGFPESTVEALEDLAAKMEQTDAEAELEEEEEEEEADRDDYE